MAVDSFHELMSHYGHSLEVASYDDLAWNVAIECTDCHVVLVDFDRDEQLTEGTETGKVTPMNTDQTDHTPIVITHADLDVCELLNLGYIASEQDLDPTDMLIWRETNGTATTLDGHDRSFDLTNGLLAD